MSNDPTTASIGARNDELAQLRAENLRLSRALVEARTEVEVTRADCDRLVAATFQGGADALGWVEFVAYLNTLRKRLDEKPRELRTSYSLHPGSILNAYREGDLSFDEACGILSSTEFSIACSALFQSPGVAAFPETGVVWTVVPGGDDDPLVRRYPVPGGWLYQVSVARAARYKKRGGGCDWDSVTWHPPQVVPSNLGKIR